MADRRPPEPPEGGVRGEVVAGLVLPGGDFAELAWNATDAEREYAARVSGYLAELYADQAGAIATLGHELRPYWPRGGKLWDALAAAPGDVRMRCLRMLTAHGLLPDG